jgi:hypothetical protein
VGAVELTDIDVLESKANTVDALFPRAAVGYTRAPVKLHAKERAVQLAGERHGRSRLQLDVHLGAESAVAGVDQFRRQQLAVVFEP